MRAVSDGPKLGAPVEATGPAPRPVREALSGRSCRLVPLDVARHGAALFAASHGCAGSEALWTYMPYGPFESEAAMATWLAGCAGSEDPLFFTILDGADGRASGMASYLRITPAHRTIEIGHIWLAPGIQASRTGTEAIFRLAEHAFDRLGYRRLEWKCNALNDRSCRAALRYGFTFEGTFRQHMIVKGRNRDTAWYAITDEEWPARRAVFLRWLDDENFDEMGRQRRPLSSMMAALAGAPTS